LKLVRIEHGIMLSFATLISLIILNVQLAPIELLLAFLVPLFLEMGAFALNDYFDVEADKLNKRMERPLVSGNIEPIVAYKLGIASLVLGSFLAFPLGRAPFLIAFALAILSWFYNKRLKDLPLAGNLFIALTMAMPFIFGAALANESNYINDLALLSAFFIGLAREIVKDVEDVEGDVKARKSKTLPALIGRRPSLLLALASFLVFFGTSTLLLAEFSKNIVSSLLLIASLFLIAYSMGYVVKDFRLDLVRKISLAAMASGLLAILLGVVG
ncbi:MAG: prenyltransferase, partial [Methanobacteriota archaeon]